MAVVTIGSDFGAQEIKSVTASTVSSSIFHKMIETGSNELILLYVEF